MPMMTMNLDADDNGKADGGSGIVMMLMTRMHDVDQNGR